MDPIGSAASLCSCSKPIAKLIIGDIVLAYNEESGEVGDYPIVATFEHLDPEIVLLTIDGELIETTPEHPFYVIEPMPRVLGVGEGWQPLSQTAGRWVDAGELAVGDHVWRADGSTGVVESVEVVAVEQRMYNLTVDVAHTFFVGDGAWLVHNAGPCGIKLTKGGNKKIGNLTDLKDLSAADAIRQRGGGASQVNQIITDYRRLTVGELANLAAQGDDAAETAIKLIKQAKKKAGKYSGK